MTTKPRLNNDELLILIQEKMDENGYSDMLDYLLDLDVVHSEMCDERRWFVCYEKVVKIDQLFVSFCYDEPKNECGDWEFDESSVSEVREKAKTVYVYE